MAYNFKIIHLKSKKEQSIIRRWKNGAILLVDNLETDLILNAPFAPSFLGLILIFKTVQKCSFSGTFLGHDQIETSQETP